MEIIIITKLIAYKALLKTNIFKHVILLLLLEKFMKKNSLKLICYLKIPFSVYSNYEDSLDARIWDTTSVTDYTIEYLSIIMSTVYNLKSLNLSWIG